MRYAIHDFAGGDLINQVADEFAPKNVTYTKYYLNGASRALSTELSSEMNSVIYDTELNLALAYFIIRFDKETKMVGYPKVQLGVEAEKTDDMELFILLQKLDVHGNHLT